MRGKQIKWVLAIAAAVVLTTAFTAVEEAPSADPVISIAGDIACLPGARVTATACHHAQVSTLLAGSDQVLVLGDNQYNSGTLSEFNGSYDLSWGQYKSITKPVPGNHEYRLQSGGAGYYTYFDGVPKWYSYDIGTWHMIALNSQELLKEGSPQNDWLEQDLAATSSECVLAYMHYPLYTDGEYAPGLPKVRPAWADLFKARADVALAGHDHIYARYAKMNHLGTQTSAGIRSFVVGTGGKSHYTQSTTTRAALEHIETQDFGVLKLTLHDGSYDWQFVNESGAVLDSGTAACV